MNLLSEDKLIHLCRKKYNKTFDPIPPSCNKSRKNGTQSAYVH